MRSATQDSSPRRLTSKLTAGVVAALALLAPALVLASDVDVAVVDVTAPTGAVTLAPGASGSISINMSVSGNQSGTATFEVYRNWTLSGGSFTGSNPQEFTVGPRGGGDPATTLSTTGTVTVAAGQPSGTFTLAVGAFDITNSNATGAKLGAGDASTYSVTVTAPPSDTTPPVITPTVVGTLGSNGWYVSDVTVSWSVVDGQSSISSTSGCDSAIVDADTSGVTLTCSATSTGGTSSQSVTIKRDATAPTISGSASPAANAAGWNNSNVTVSFTCDDAPGSGVASCSSSQTLSSEGTGQSVTGTAVDLAGNESSTTVSGINIDKTAPTISGSASPAANVNGWNNTDVTVSFTCGDAPGSGVASCASSQTLTGEGTGQSVTGTALDLAGNESSTTVSGINIDKTAPTISGSASPAANAAGWNKDDVTVSFTCGDTPGSGVASCPSSQTLTSDGTGQSVTGTAVDRAGNERSTTVSGIDIDKTAPVVTVTGVANGGVYTLGSVPVAGCSTSDALSGVESHATAGAPTGGPVGSVTVTCSGAADHAGNTNSASVTYQVVYAWTGFFQPVDNPTIVNGQMNFGWNKAKAGSAIPVKFDLGGNQGLDIFAAGHPKVVSVVCNAATATADLVEETVTANSSGLKYDTVAGQYVYVWKTATTFAGKCFRLDVKLTDDTTHSAYFNFTK